jgi:hypothetical protein
MWFLGKRESVNVWKKADFDGFREKEEFVFRFKQADHRYWKLINHALT